jgi:multiple antibiotic resistance protein
VNPQSVIDTRLFVSVFVTLFVIMDPPGSIPLFLSLTGGRSGALRRKMAGQAVVVAIVVISLFAVFGQTILDYLEVSVPALQAAGGLLLLLVALELLTGKAGEPVETKNVNVALVPLGTPLLAGPGAIVATIVFAEQADALPDLVAVALAIIAVHLVLWLTLRYSVGIIRLIGDSGVSLISRISGLLLSAIAVQLVADAVTAFVAAASGGTTR